MSGRKVQDVDQSSAPSVATTTVSSPTLWRVVSDFAAAYPTLSDPDLCRDQCLNASEAFVEECCTAGVQAHLITGAQFGEVEQFPGVRLLLNAHTAVLVANTSDEEAGDGVVYDWTARQFDADCDWPLMMGLRQWRERWAHPDNW